MSEMECTKDQLEKQRAIILNLQNKQRRKERTRQLIQRGALAETYFFIHDVGSFEKCLIQQKTKMNLTAIGSIILFSSSMK